MFNQVNNQNIRYFYPVTPNNQRKLTDTVWVAFYILLTLIIVIAFFYSFILEHEKNLFEPKDPSGNRCGQDQASQYPYIYFPAPFLESLDRTVCVAQCPSSLNEKQIKCLPNSVVKSCRFDMTDHFNRSNQFIIYPTHKNPFLSLCQPQSEILDAIVESKINTHELLINFKHIYDAKYIIMFVCPGVCLLLMLIYVGLIFCCQNMKPIFVGIILCFFLTVAFLCSFFFLPQTTENLAYSKLIGFIFLIILLLSVGYIVSQKNYFMRGLDLINIGTVYVRNNIRLLMMPISMLLIWAIVFSLELFLLIFIYSINSNGRNDKQSEEYTFPYIFTLNHSGFVIFLLILSITHYVWTNTIVQHLGKFVSRVGAAYWIMHIPKPFKNALYTMFAFHFGSIIKGSILITLLGWITDILYFFMPDSNNQLSCCTCNTLAQFFRNAIFRKYLGCFSDLYYIQIGLQGQCYSEASQKMIPPILDHMKYVNQAYKMGKRVLDMSQLLVAVLTSTICFIVIEISIDIQSDLLTILVIFFISFLLSSLGFNAYDRAFETLLLTIILNSAVIEDPISRIGTSHFAHTDNQTLKNDDRMRVYMEAQNWMKEQKEKHRKIVQQIRQN